MTPALSALAFRIGPTVPSSSAFMRITWVPLSMASSTSWAPWSMAPVTSTMASTSPAAARIDGSSVTAGRPFSIATWRSPADVTTSMSAASTPAWT
jgi:hypothetical protein